MSETVIHPQIGRNVYIAPTAYVGGDVVIGDDCTIMHHVAIRGDISPIRVGKRVNVQDGSVLHTYTGVPLDVGDDVSIGHRAVIHCRRVGDGCLIGIGVIVLDKAEIGDECLIAAGSLVPPGMIVPPGKVLMGTPARVVRDVNDDDRQAMAHALANYARLGRQHGAGIYPNHCE